MQGLARAALSPRLLIHILLCAALLLRGLHTFPGVLSPEGSLLRLGGGGGRARIWAVRMSRPACPLFCLLSLCREMPQGLFPPALRAFGAGAVTKAPQEPALRLKLVLGRGWEGEEPRGVPG